MDECFKSGIVLALIDSVTKPDEISTRQHLVKPAELLVKSMESAMIRAEKLLQCGAINEGDYNPEHYLLAKLLVTDALREESEHWLPTSAPEYKRVLTNLKRY